MMIFYIYQAISMLLFPAFVLNFFIRVIAKKEYLSSFFDRIGFCKQIKTTKPIFYIHAASLGEVKSAFLLIDTLIKNGYFVKLTVVTITGYQASSEYFDKNNNISISFLPFDTIFCVMAFFIRLKPKKIAIIESELWPNLIFFGKQIAKQIYHINTRLSAKSMKRWLFFKRNGFNIFEQFDHIFPSMQAVSEDIMQFNENVTFAGNLKQDYIKIYNKHYKNWNFSNIKSKNNTFLLSSVRTKEVEIILNSLQKMPKIIICPRYLQDVQKIINILNERNLQYSMIDDAVKQKKNTEQEIVIVDKFGIMPYLYDISDVVFIGASLIPNLGGHSPIEAFCHKKPVIIGNFHNNCAEYVQKLSQNKCLEIVDSSNISDVLFKIMQNYDEYIENINILYSKKKVISAEICKLIT